MVLAAYRAARPGPRFAELRASHIYVVAAGDVVSCAHELAPSHRNVARVHHDASTSGSRLVYGGRAIGLALHQAVRYRPDLRTVVGWLSTTAWLRSERGRHADDMLSAEQTELFASCGVLLACAPCSARARTGASRSMSSTGALSSHWPR